MNKILLILICTLSLSANDIIIKESNYSVDKTVENIKNIVTKKGLKVFNIINHHENAKNNDIEMQESTLIIFGNPKIGTVMMKENILSSLDLPMKVLVYKDNDKKVKLAYRDGSWLKKTHSLTNEKIASKVNGALDKITTKAAK